MSVNRLAIIAAVSAFAHHRNNNHSSPTTATTRTRTTPTVSSASSSSSSSSSTLETSLYYNASFGGSFNGGGGGSGGGGNYDGNDVDGITYGGNGIRRGQQNMRSGFTSLHGNVNILLGGAMFSVVIAIVGIICYCCHRSIKKRTSLYRQRWLENDSNIEIYSVEQCYETAGLFLETSEGGIPPNSIHHVPMSSHSEPPPSYDAVLAMDQIVNRSLCSSVQPPKYHRNHHCSNQYHNHHHQQQEQQQQQQEQINQFKDEMLKYSPTTPIATTLSNNNNVDSNGNSNICQFDTCSLVIGQSESLLDTTGGGSVVGGTPYNNNVLLNMGLNNHHHQHKTPTIITKVTTNNGNYYYNSGCPLCGKFQYNTSQSIDSSSGDCSLESIINADIENGNSGSNCNCPSLKDFMSSSKGEVPSQPPPPPPPLNNEAATSTTITTNGCIVDDSGEEHQTTVISTSNGNDDGENHSLKLDSNSNTVQESLNNNSNQSIIENSNGNLPSATTEEVICANSDGNGNGDSIPEVFITLGGPGEFNDLESINESGIVRLDMSRIIDKTGLPTYEAAIKLESSGYV